MTANLTTRFKDTRAVIVDNKDHLDVQNMIKLGNIHDKPGDNGARAATMTQSVNYQATARAYHKMDRGEAHTHEESKV